MEVIKSSMSFGLGSGAEFSDASSLRSSITCLGSGGIPSGLTGSMLSFLGKNGYFSGYAYVGGSSGIFY